MFLGLLALTLSKYNLYLPQYCVESNTITLSPDDDEAFKVPITFDGDLLKPQVSSKKSVTLTYSSQSPPTGSENDYVCVVMWGTGFLKYDSSLSFETDAFISRKLTSQSYNASGSTANETKTKAFLLNFDDEDVNVARFHRTGGSGTIYLYNSAELDMDDAASYVTNEDVASGTLSNDRDDEAILVFFPEGGFDLTVTANTELELEPICFRCNNSDTTGKCKIKELDDAEGYGTVNIKGGYCDFLYIEVGNDGKGKTVEFDFSFKRVSSARSVLASEKWMSGISSSFTIGQGQYIKSYSDFSSRNVGAIVGGVIGGVAGVCIICAVVFFVVRYTKGSKK